MCTEQWMHVDIKVSEQVTTNEQMLADVELLDRLQKGLSIASLTFFLLSSILYVFMLPRFLYFVFMLQSFKPISLMIEASRSKHEVEEGG